MRDLIKKILKEYKDETTANFRVIGNIKDLISESIPKEEFDKLNSISRRYLRNVNPFTGVFNDKRTDEDIEVTFNIILTKHYIDRLKRLSDPEYQEGSKKFNPNIMDPDLFEGIDLLVSNADELAKLVVTKRIQDNDIVEFSTRDGSNYHMIVKFDQRSLTDLSFHLILKTQIKGVNFYNKQGQKDFGLYKK